MPSLFVRPTSSRVESMRQARSTQRQNRLTASKSKTLPDLVRWSGRRDSNPRPSPWQGDLIYLPGFTQFSDVLLRPGIIHQIRLNSTP